MLESEVQAAGGEWVLLYYEDIYEGSSLTLEHTSALMDEYGWESSWRILDDEVRTIWEAGQGDPGDLWDWGIPALVVIDTAEMRVIANETSIDVLALLATL